MSNPIKVEFSGDSFKSQLIVEGIGIEVCSPGKALFIRLDDWVFYIDNSTNEQYMSRWESGQSHTEEAIDGRLKRWGELTWAQQETLSSLIDHIANVGEEFTFGSCGIDEKSLES